MFKFVSSDGTGSIKRQQAQKACDSCRKRKKRCNHGSNATSTNSPPARAPGQVNSDDRVSQAAKSYTASSLSCATDAEYQSTTSREETGHISPAASTLASSDQDLEAARILSGGTRIQANTSHSQEPTGVQSRFIGDLNPESIFLAATSPDAIRGVLPDSVGYTSLQHSGKSLTIFRIYNRRAQNLFYGCPPLVRDVLVPLIEQDCLSTMPPIPHLEVLSRIYFEKINTIFPIINETMFRNLAPSVPCRALLEQAICLAASKNFAAADHLILDEAGPPMTCKAFGEKVSGAMRLTIELGIVTDKNCPDPSPVEDLASQFSGKATHYLEGMGLHLEGQVEDASAKLLCCVYALDRMNAAFHGRPVLMHERDMRRDLHQCFNQQEPAFRLFLQVISLLDNVIEIYRPPNQSEQGGMDVQFPAFEELVLECAAAHIGTSSLATIEIFYHSISIISLRSHIWAEPKRSTPSYLRQALSTSILSSTTTHELQDQLVLFPFVPYAISLSLSIAYREMRHNKLPVHRMRARGQFQASCRLLEGLESQYCTAANAANMGKKMLREIDRVFSTVSSENRPTVPQHDVSNISENSSMVTDNSTPMTNTENQSVAPNSNTHIIPSIAPIYTGMQDFDPSLFDLNATGDIDLFSMFDPSFDLVGFDACLEGNLNLGFPTPAPHP
ncbi:fungal specific transcription factor [Botrytis cinerea]